MVKCHNTSCCSPFRSFITNILPDRFVPPPYPLQHSYKEAGNEADRVTLSDSFIPKLIDNVKLLLAPLTLRLAFKMTPRDKHFSFIPYDFYCPSVQGQLKRKICNICSLYFATIKSLTSHKKEVHKKEGRTNTKLTASPEQSAVENASDLDVDDTENDSEPCNNGINNDDRIYVIDNLNKFLESPWVEDE